MTNLPGWILSYFGVVYALAIAERDKSLISVGCCRGLALGTEPSLQLLRCQLGSRTRTQSCTDDLSLADIVALVFVVCHEFQSIVYKLRKSQNAAVAEFGQFAPCEGIGFPRLIELDGVGFTANFFPTSLAADIVEDPPNSTALGPFIDTARHNPSSGLSVGLQKLLNPILQPPKSPNKLFRITDADWRLAGDGLRVIATG